MNSRHAASLLLTTALLLNGCSERKFRPLNPCTVTGVVQNVSAGGAQNVDLLFVIDNSGSMAEEQAALTAQLENVVRVLLTGDLPDGQHFPPVASLRVGVISSDMGVLGVGAIPTALDRTRTTDPVPTCGADANGYFFGDDGAIELVTTASPAPAGCEAEYASFLEFPSGALTQEDFVTDVGCTAILGTSGCGFEMQLESMLTAVTDSSRVGAPTFAPATSSGAPRDRVGRATPGQPNAAFFREDSVIAIVAITDEEDCSTDNPEMFMFSPADSALQDPMHSDFAGGDYRVNTRCLFFDEELYAIERYVDGLRALRPEDPTKVVFAGIVGIPNDLGDSVSPAEILADPRMSYTDILDVGGTIEDPTARWGVFTEPACFRCASDPTVTSWRDCPDDADANESGPNPAPDRNEDLQWAAPGRRFVELAAKLDEAGMTSVVHSICTDDFGPAMADILRRIGRVLRGACLPRALNRDQLGRVNCDVVEILPHGMRCADRVDAGRDGTAIRLEDDPEGDREVCRIDQLPPTGDDIVARRAPAGTGWYYDDYTTAVDDCDVGPGETRQRIAFTDDALPVPGSNVRLECLEPVQGSGLEGADISAPCTEDARCAFGSVEDAERFVFRYDLDRSRFIDASGNLTGVAAMRCEAATNTCQITCGDASDCPGGFVCLSSTDGTGWTADCGATACFCANPICTFGSAGASGASPTPDGGP